MGWLVNIIASCSLVRSFGNVRGCNKSSVMRIKHNNTYDKCMLVVIEERGEWSGVGEVGGEEKGREKGQQLNLRIIVSSKSSSIIIF